jgi:hypothetical protein
MKTKSFGGKIMINDEKILEMIGSAPELKGKSYYYFYCVKEAGVGAKMLLGALSGFASKYFIACVNEAELALIGLDMMGKPQGISLIPMSEVSAVKISGWMFGIGKKIRLSFQDGSKLILKANKHVVSIKNQKKNLDAFQEMANNMKLAS